MRVHVTSEIGVVRGGPRCMTMPLRRDDPPAR